MKLSLQERQSLIDVLVEAEKWIQKASTRMEQKGTKGSFKRAAARAGMDTRAFTRKVLNDPNASPAMKKKANFARNVMK